MRRIVLVCLEFDADAGEGEGDMKWWLMAERRAASNSEPCIGEAGSAWRRIAAEFGAASWIEGLAGGTVVVDGLFPMTLCLKALLSASWNASSTGMGAASV
jgi:hypothetical protein